MQFYFSIGSILDSGGSVNMLILSPDSKMGLFGMTKCQYTYSDYLDSCSQDVVALTKFRLSLHPFPIERGRYVRPKLPRNKRKCVFCNDYIGSEFHVMMECNNRILKDLRIDFMSKVLNVCPDLQLLPLQQQFVYIFSCNDTSIIKETCSWVAKCYEVHNKI